MPLIALDVPEFHRLSSPHSQIMASPEKPESPSGGRRLARAFSNQQMAGVDDDFNTIAVTTVALQSDDTDAPTAPPKAPGSPKWLTFAPKSVSHDNLSALDTEDIPTSVMPVASAFSGRDVFLYNPEPQAAPGASAAVGHNIENSIPLSIFPIAMDKIAICFCGLPGRGKTHISRRLARYLEFFHAAPVGVFNVSEYRRKLYGCMKGAS
jgi:hypothetical protein